MAIFRTFLVLGLLGLACASPVTSYREGKSTEFEDDPFGYLQDQFAAFFNSFLEKDNFQVSEDVEVKRNDAEESEVSGRSGDYEGRIEKYIKTHDVTFKVPVVGTVRLGARNLDSDELDFSLQFGGKGVEEGRKSKLKKIFIPILVFVLLKAITVVPLVLGILILKSWNALQLSIISFVISTGLAIFQLCKKIAENNAQAQVATHGPWEAPSASQHYARAFGYDQNAQNLAYSAYAP
ncbi:hypothetical protein JTB14_009697 [Gonioctena quinquepunctata]|nr:hypothetical protein JTB14_009697 [Gonioctena quinquepunctata]